MARCCCRSSRLLSQLVSTRGYRASFHHDLCGMWSRPLGIQSALLPTKRVKEDEGQGEWQSAKLHSSDAFCSEPNTAKLLSTLLQSVARAFWKFNQFVSLHFISTNAQLIFQLFVNKVAYSDELDRSVHKNRGRNAVKWFDRLNFLFDSIFEKVLTKTLHANYRMEKELLRWEYK